MTDGNLFLVAKLDICQKPTIASALVDIQSIPFVTITGERARCVDAELFASSKTTV